ncbi:TPA: type I restriction endonuclease subunit R [Campylobacter jejuni]|nr:type I restriction endonuclease subunit R [Campylobacter jejuni]HBG2685287.1 type I restriction endonuclease subunit R [Campylobacter jejuni]HBG2688373.1 type I restriction endonuclease subunit R [Campylobacter jejuni]HBG2696231.1 type I restriction endonuclease subunit R [Campylobacter jejuni]HBG2742328.1 type I restriction endonuclease subunit R [Campylobacter jejuni]
MSKAKTSEFDLEQFVISSLLEHGWCYEKPVRATDEVLLETSLVNALCRLNPQLDLSKANEIYKELKSKNHLSLLDSNENFHYKLVNGVNINTTKDGESRADIINLIDFNNASNNEFIATNQLSITEAKENKIPDVVLYINGIPLVLMELKSPSDENATINSAYNQINTYKQTIPSIFTYNAFCVISDGYFARAGSISADFSRFMAWKSSDGINYAPNKSLEIKTLIDGMLNPKTLLDIICNFIVFEKEQIRDLNGILSIKTTKKIACYHQYYAVNKAISRTITASSKDGDKKGGVVWHTQGSGKSLSMVFYSAKAIKALNNPTILLITDRNDLDDQLFGTFASCANLLRQEPKQANDKEHLKELLRVASGGVVFTTIQKFSPENDNVFECLSLRDNIIVIADEAHRTQYGFDAKVVEEKSKSGDVLGQKIVYGFAKYLRDALPNATYIGFTGTPIESHDINTPAVFGNYIDIYDISRAVEDGATVSIYYESRLAKIELSEEGKRLVNELDEKLEIVEQMLPNDYEKYFELDTGAKLEYILDVEEHILSNEDGKNRFIKEFAALDKAYTIAMPHEKALSIKNKIAFMYAIKARFLKFAKENENENLLNQALIKQVVDKAIVSSKVVDIFDASGIKKPDISILSDEFLLEVKNMKRKNLAFEMLKKILNDEIKAREKLSLTKAKKLAQMLSDAIKKYNNKLISSSEALDELINMSKSIVSMEDEAKKLGLKDYEYAFYSALACNDEYEKILGNEKLLALVSEILQIIKNNVSIDWMIKENVRARLRVAVKRVLNKYGYPPDMQQLAIDGVLAQAEILAKELANE